MRNTVRVGLGVCMLFAFVVGVAGAGQAQRLEEATGVVPVTNGWLEFRGNDYVARGRTERFATAEGSTFFFLSENPNSVHMSGNQGTSRFTLHLRAPVGNALTVGTYVDAARYTDAPDDVPGFDFGADTRGCTRLRAEVRVNQISIVDNVIQAIDLHFVHHCEDFMGFGEGRLVVNYATPSPLPVHQATMAFLGGDDFERGSYRFSNNPDSEFVLAQSERDGNSLFVNAFTNPPRDGQWYLAIAAPAGQQLGVGTYENASGTRLSFSQSWYGSCDTELGSFTIHQLHVAPDGSVDLLDLTFDRMCEDRWPARGHVVIGLPIPVPAVDRAIAATGKVTPASPTVRVRSEATVTGTVTCRVADSVTVKVVVTQTVKGLTASGMEVQTFPCTKNVAVPWTLVAPSGLGTQFQPGSATVTVTTTAHFLPWTDTTAVSTETTTLVLVPRPPASTVPRR